MRRYALALAISVLGANIIEIDRIAVAKASPQINSQFERGKGVDSARDRLAINTNNKSQCYANISERVALADRRISRQQKKVIVNIARADKYFSSGLAKFREENYPGALKDLNKAIDLNPQSFCAYYYRARTKTQKIGRAHV